MRYLREELRGLVWNLLVAANSFFQRYSQDSNRTSRTSLGSWYFPEEGTLTTFSALIVLKMIFFDIAISLGDAVTDVAQGITLIADFSTFPPQYKDLTADYGVMVLVVCWIPGLVAVIHIMSHYRSENFYIVSPLFRLSINSINSVILTFPLAFPYQLNLLTLFPTIDTSTLVSLRMWTSN